jgi:NADH-quinone oxidoreductase subunit E
MDQSSMLSDATCQKIQALLSKYPRKRSALIPSLQLAQDELGFLSPETMCEIARIFDLSPNEVHEVVSFYTMFYKKPMGKYVIQVCTNISCLLCNAEEIAEHLKQRLGIPMGETTADKKFTLMEVECLGSCGTSPVVQINEDYYEELTPEKIDRILDSLQ